MSERRWKTEAVRQRACAVRIYEEAYPDVGMGPSWPWLVDQAAKELGLGADDFDRDVLIAEGPSN